MRDEWQETEAEVLRICRDLDALRPRIQATENHGVDDVQAEVLAKLRELMRAKDAMMRAVLREAYPDRNPDRP